MGIVNDLTELKTLSDGVVANKVSRFAYKESAYTQNDVNGVNTYDANQDNNIPVGTANVMKVNQTVIELGWRARASSITRMLMNHFLGRISYNLNKVNDWFNELLAKLLSSLGNPDGIALLNSNGIVPDTMLPSSLVRNVSDLTPDNTGKVDLTKQTDITKILSGNLIGQIFGRLFGTYWKNVATDIFTSNADLVTCLKYANGIWVAGKAQSSYGSMGELYWSEDGEIWTKCTGVPSTGVPSTGVIVSLDYTGGLWFAGCNGNGEGLLWSEDGKDWHACTGDITSHNNTGHVIYANNIFVGVGASSPYWSTDGKNWTAGTYTGSVHFSSPVYGNGVWIASNYRDGGLLKSTDGKDWTDVSGVANSTFIPHFDPATNLFVTTGDAILWSSDGDTWTQALTTSYSVLGVLFIDGVSFAYVSGNDEYYIYKSFDDKSWNRVATFSDYITSMAYANGLILIGGHNFIYKSMDLGNTFIKDLEVWDGLVVADIDLLCYGKDKWLSAHQSQGASSSWGLRKSDYSVLLEKGMLQ